MVSADRQLKGPISPTARQQLPQRVRLREFNRALCCPSLADHVSQGNASTDVKLSGQF